MKNVAGYDVTRLLVGSAGTLGFITDLTFRILALPQVCTALAARGSLQHCGAAAACLLQSKLEPNLVVAVPAHVAASLRDADSGHAATGLPWQLIAGFEGFRETVAAQVVSCRKVFEQHCLSCQSPQDYPAHEGPCQTLFDVLYQAPFALRADLPPNRVVAFLLLFIWPNSDLAAGGDYGDWYQTWMGVQYVKAGEYSSFRTGLVMANYNCFEDQVLPQLGIFYQPPFD